MSGLTRIGAITRAVEAGETPTTRYVEFNPPRRPEEYRGAAGPHNGLALTWDVIQAIARSEMTGEAHGCLVRGEWVRSDGVRFLDFAIDRAWVAANSNYQLVEGQLRWVCPGCGRMSGNHSKGCDYR